ncbi:MAG: acetyl-CoA carboxylase biotin carboxyl carrier protein [Peptostreptococcaceae bacterium]
MDFEKLLKLIDVVDKASFSKFNYKENSIEINIEKSVLNEKYMKREMLREESKINDKLDCDIYEIKSPLIGTFYISPSPDEKPFVSVGQKVSKGDVIGIIEAMKIMNEVTSSEDGIIEEILVKSNDIVEYGQSILKVKRI